MPPRYVTDPRLIAELNDRADAQSLGLNYDNISQSQAYQQNRQQNPTQTGFGYGGAHEEGGGSILHSLYVGAIQRPAEAIGQMGNHAVNAMAPGIVSDNDVAYRDAVTEIRELRDQRAREAAGRGGTDYASIAGGLLTPLPRVARLGRLGNAALQGAEAAALQPVDTSNGQDFLSGKLAQATEGSIFGLGTGAVVNRLTRGRGPNAGPTMRDAVEAGDRIGVPMSVAEASTNPVVRQVTSLSQNLPGGGRLARQAENTQNRFEERVAQTADDMGGSARSRYDIGASAQRGLQDDVNNFRTQSDDLYNMVDAHTRAVPDFVPTRLLSALQGRAADFPTNPQLGSLLQNPRLRAFFDTLVERDDGGRIQNTRAMPFSEAQALRSELGSMTGNSEVLNGIPHRELSHALGALTDDMGEALQPHPQAARAWNRATTFYRAGRDRISRVHDQLLGDIPPEQTADRIVQMVRNNSRDTASLRRSLSPEHWDEVASGIFRNLGHETAAGRDAANEGFSVARFLTDFNKLRENQRAFDFAFGGTRYEHLAPVMRDLGTLADRFKLGSRLGNSSRSGHYGALTGVIMGAFYNPMVAAKLVGSNWAFANLMSRPGFARWLLHAGQIASTATRNTGEGLMRAHVERLLPLMNSEHGIAHDALRTMYSTLGGMATGGASQPPAPVQQ